MKINEYLEQVKRCGYLVTIDQELRSIVVTDKDAKYGVIMCVRIAIEGLYFVDVDYFNKHGNGDYDGGNAMMLKVLTKVLADTPIEKRFNFNEGLAIE
ncbi:hypothetical protein [uncultured Limosilactobacillus sp.]|uniref:hypothetical protein n=1 Tax=uncultured Limosilactobacillus sp. TaxID=2837629 RepID=UPI0025E162E1|nr:hypothetical protein [uncultured Limosilactobacillus sp.]